MEQLKERVKQQLNPHQGGGLVSLTAAAFLVAMTLYQPGTCKLKMQNRNCLLGIYLAISRSILQHFKHEINTGFSSAKPTILLSFAA